MQNALSRAHLLPHRSTWVTKHRLRADIACWETKRKLGIVDPNYCARDSASIAAQIVVSVFAVGIPGLAYLYSVQEIAQFLGVPTDKLQAYWQAVKALWTTLKPWLDEGFRVGAPIVKEMSYNMFKLIESQVKSLATMIDVERVVEDYARESIAARAISGFANSLSGTNAFDRLKAQAWVIQTTSGIVVGACFLFHEMRTVLAPVAGFVAQTAFRTMRWYLRLCAEATCLDTYLFASGKERLRERLASLMRGVEVEELEETLKMLQQGVPVPDDRRVIAITQAQLDASAKAIDIVQKEEDEPAGKQEVETTGTKRKADDEEQFSTKRSRGTYYRGACEDRVERLRLEDPNYCDWDRYYAAAMAALGAAGGLVVAMEPSAFYLAMKELRMGTGQLYNVSKAALTYGSYGGSVLAAYASAVLALWKSLRAGVTDLWMVSDLASALRTARRRTGKQSPDMRAELSALPRKELQKRCKAAGVGPCNDASEAIINRLLGIALKPTISAPKPIAPAVKTRAQLQALSRKELQKQCKAAGAGPCNDSSDAIIERLVSQKKA